MREHLLSVDFSIDNELVAILGRDGAGKTEILRSVAGVYAPENGRIEIQGRTVYDATIGINLPPVERHVGWVPLVSALFPGQTVADNVAFPLRRGGRLSDHEAARRIDEVLDLVELSSARNTLVQDLDLRWQQFVAIARALVLDPEVLLLDQPFRSMNNAVRRASRHDLQELRRRINVPAIIATRDLEEAYEIADRVALLDRGQILQFDDPRDLVTRPASRRVAELVRSVNIFPGEVVDQFYDGVAVETGIGTLQVLGAEQDLGPVQVVVRPEHIRIVALNESIPTDANVFVGEVLDHVDHGSLHSLTFHPDGAAIRDVLEVSVGDAEFQQRNLSELGTHKVILPPRAIHLIAGAGPPEDPIWRQPNDAPPDILTFDNQSTSRPLDQ